MTTPSDVRGIETLLIKMRRAPDSALLRERILALLADLPDNDEKVRLTIELADVVRKGDPLSGLRIAWMAYQYDRESIAALTGIAESLRRLGRDQKAEQVRMEIERLRSGKGKGKHGTTFELHSDDIAATRVENPAGGRGAAGRSSGDDEMNRDDRTVAIEIEELENAKRAWREEIDRKIEKDPNAFLSDTDRGGGADSNSEPRADNDGMDRSGPEDDAPRGGKKRGGLKLIKQKEPKAVVPPSAEKAGGKGESRPGAPAGDPVFAVVDQLMKAGEYFAAMVEVRHAVSENLTQQTAAKALVRLRVIWEKLGLRGFDWKEEEGPQVFLARAKRPLLPTVSGLFSSTSRVED